MMTNYPCNRELTEALTKSLMGLRGGVEAHCRLIKSVIEGLDIDNGLLQVQRQSPKNDREVIFREAIIEAIKVLEESRRSFKSKQLESLRKRLTQALIDVVPIHK